MKSKVLVDELRGITTIDLAFKAASILEKIWWVTILLIGTIWACYFIEIQFELWDEQPSIVTKADNFDLSDLNFPAISICSKVEALSVYFLNCAFLLKPILYLFGVNSNLTII